MQPHYLTKAKIAELADISIGRVKYAMSKFTEYFPPSYIGGKSYPVYEPESVEIVKLITSMIKDSDHTMIRQALNDANFSPIYDAFESSNKAVTVTGELTTVTMNQQLLSNNRDLHTALETMDALRQLNEHQRQVIDDQKLVIDDLKRQLDNS